MKSIRAMLLPIFLAGIGCVTLPSLKDEPVPKAAPGLVSESTSSTVRVGRNEASAGAAGRLASSFAKPKSRTFA